MKLLKACKPKVDVPIALIVATLAALTIGPVLAKLLW